MPRIRLFWIVVFLLTSLGGCRKTTQSHDVLVKEAIASMRKSASSLNEVKDVASAEQTIKVLQQETQTLKSLQKRLGELGAASSSGRTRVKQHSDDMIAASQQMVQASSAVVAKIQAGQFLPELANRLAAASRDYGQSMADFSQQAIPLFE